MGRKKKYKTEEERVEAKRLVALNYYYRNKEKQIEYKQEYYEKNKEIISEKNKERYLNRSEEQKEDERIHKKEYRERNVDKIREQGKVYSKQNKDKIRANSKKWAENNPEKMREASKRWRENNPEKSRLALAKSVKKRKDTDPLFKLTCNIRKMMSKCIKRNGFTKKSRTHEILGCSFEEFKNYIELQWKDWMNWDNYGKYNGDEGHGWDFDHIIPLKLCESEDDIYILNHYSNLQPLCSKINRDIKKDNL